MFTDKNDDVHAHDFQSTKTGNWLSDISALKTIEFDRAPYQAVLMRSCATKDDFTPARLQLGKSSDGFSFQEYITKVPTETIRDPSMIKTENNGYYLIESDGLYQTFDLMNWKNLNWDWKSLGFDSVWAPEFFRDKDNHVKVVISQCEHNTTPHGTELAPFSVYTYDFDIHSGHLSNMQKLTPARGTVFPEKLIDPDIKFDAATNLYYLVVAHYTADSESTIDLYCSSQIESDWTQVPLNFDSHKINGSVYEAPEIEWIENQWVLYVDAFSNPQFNNQDGIMFSPITPLSSDGVNITESLKPMKYTSPGNDYTPWAICFVH